MKTSYPLSRTQRAMLQRIDDTAAKHKLELARLFLAGHDVTDGDIVGIDDVGLVVETPDSEAPPAIPRDSAA